MLTFSLRTVSFCTFIIVLLYTHNNMSAQSITLKSAYPIMNESVVTISDIDNNGEAEIVMQSNSAIRFKNGKTMLAEWMIILDSTKGESLFTEESIAPRLKDLSLWKDYNGNGIADVLIGGGDENGGYIRFVDPSTGTTLLKTGYIPTVYALSIADTDKDGFFDIVISRDDSLLIYTTQAKVATGGGGTDVHEMPLMNTKGTLSIAPNPTNGNTKIFSANTAVEEATIYGMRGERIASLKQNGTGTLIWNGKDESGNEVAAGTYYILAKTSSGNSEVGIINRR